MTNKYLAFESSVNAVRFLLNRGDLTPDERKMIERCLGYLNTLKDPEGLKYTLSGCYD